MSPLLPLETSSNTVLTEGEIEEFEEFYRRIGWWRGPVATPEARKSVREFWVDRGPRAVTWLVERIAKETHGDVLDGVANLLADIGPASIEPIIGKMEGEPTRDQAEVLLKALARVYRVSFESTYPAMT
jgi:hypothetical protein